MKSERSVKLLTGALAAGVIALVIFCGIQIPHLSTQYSVRDFFPKNHPNLLHDREVARIFQLEDSPVFVAVLSRPPGAKEPGWLKPGPMKELEKITTDLQATQGVRRAISLATVEMAIQEKNDLQIGPVFQTMAPTRWEDFVRSQALLSPQLISPDRRSVLVAVEPTDLTPRGLAQMEKKIRRTISSSHPELQVGVGGVPAVQARLAERLQSEVGRFLLLCMVTFCLLFILFYRNWAPVIFTAVGLIVINVTTIGLLGLFGMNFTVLLSTLPVIISIAFVSLVIHTLHLWADRLQPVPVEERRTRRFHLALKVLKEISLPNLLGSLTTAIGFLTLAAVNIPVIRTYALVVTGSVLWVWLISQPLFVMALPWLDPQQREWTRKRAYWMLWITRWSLPLYAGIIGVTVFLGLAGHGLNFSARLFDDLPAKESARQTTELMDRQFGGSVPMNVLITEKASEAWKNPQNLRRLHRALGEIRRVSGVGSALGVTDFLGSQPLKSAAAVAETYFLFSMSSENPLRNYVDASMKETRLALRLQDMPTAKVHKARAKVRSILARHFPKAQIVEAGLAVNSHSINQEVAKDLVFGFWHSLVLIGVLLLCIFRSWRWALVACLPNLVPPAILIGFLALFQTPVKPGVALIFSIALGLAFNNTVYMLSRLRALRNDKKMQALPLRRALLEEGNPCLSESLVMFSGFLIFLTSDFKLNQTFGAYMVLSIIAGAIGDLVFLPALLRLYPEILRGRLSKGEGLDEGSEKNSTPGRIAAGLAALLFVNMATPSTAVADEAKDLLQKSRRSLEARSDQATVTLKIIEPNGDVKSRKLTLKTLRDGNTFRALVRILSPADVKGTALLAEIKKGQENQWLYLPSSKQVRRVVSGKKSGGVLGSELSADDLNSQALQSAKVQLVKKTGQMAVLQVTPATGTSEYSKVLTSLSLPEGLPQRTEYYVGAKLKKTVEFKDYTSPDGKVKRAKKIIVRNLLNKRGTDVELTDIKVNGALEASDFTPDALKSE